MKLPKYGTLQVGSFLTRKVTGHDARLELVQQGGEPRD